MQIRSRPAGTGAILGMLIGVVLSSMTGQWWWIGVGFAVGFAIAGLRRDRS